MRHVEHVIRAIPAPGPPWDRIVAWVPLLHLAANNMSLNCCSMRLDASCCQPGLRTACFKIIHVSCGYGPPPVAWRLPLRLTNSESLGHPPNGGIICIGTSGCTRATLTLPWITATMRTLSCLLHTDSSPRPESVPSTPKSGGGCERTVLLNPGSQPAGGKLARAAAQCTRMTQALCTIGIRLSNKSCLHIQDDPMECREPSVLAGGKAPRTLSKQSLTDQWLWLSSQVRRRLVVGCLPDSIFWSCPHGIRILARFHNSVSRLRKESPVLSGGMTMKVSSRYASKWSPSESWSFTTSRS